METTSCVKKQGKAAYAGALVHYALGCPFYLTEEKN